MLKRELFTAGIGLGLGLAGAGSAFAQQAASAAPPQRRQRPEVKKRTATTKVLFKTPPGYPNALATAPEGLWIGEQKLSDALARQYGVQPPTDLSEKAWLVDWNGKVLRTVVTQSRNTSGMAYGDGYVWMIANAPPQGVFQTDMDSKTISHRQIPLGPADNGGGSHGGLYHEGKLWIVANRIRGILRVDPKTWTPEFMIPITVPRWHDIAWDNGTIWMITGNQSNSFAEGRHGLVRYDASTGELLEEVELAPGSADPHGLAMHNGKLISCDAGIHPNWKNEESPYAGTIFQIDIA
jgi:hypothetical protein